MQGQRQHDEQVSKIIEGYKNVFYRLFSIVYAKSEMQDGMGSKKRWGRAQAWV